MKTLSMTAVALVVSLLAGAPAAAETFKVEMRNRGEKGSMVFEPDFLALKPGDRIKFIATHKSHNAASIDGMFLRAMRASRARSTRRSRSPLTSRAFTASSARRISAWVWSCS